MSDIKWVEYDFIWLEPHESVDPYDGRQWCQDDVWGDEGVKYIRADLAASEPAVSAVAPDLTKFAQLLESYWAEAFRHGETFVRHDSKDGAAQEAETALMQAFKAQADAIERLTAERDNARREALEDEREMAKVIYEVAFNYDSSGVTEKADGTPYGCWAQALKVAASIRAMKGDRG